jgi:formate/nitrite transporter FocA (FNT family)
VATALLVVHSGHMELGGGQVGDQALAIASGMLEPWTDFVTANLIPVTIGNIIGGVVLVALVYRFVYLRAERR